MIRLQHNLLLLLLMFFVAPTLAAELEEQNTGALSANSYAIDYHITLKSDDPYAQISIDIKDTQFLKSLNFNLKSGAYQNLQATGSLTVKNNRALWVLPSKNATLTFTAKIPHKRANNEFDALITPNYAIFRGDDLIPPARVKFKGNKKIPSIATLHFNLPKTWKSVNTGWPRSENNSFIIDNPTRFFDRPTGWMIAGKLGTRRERLGNTDISVSAPIGESTQRMEALTLLAFIWPTLDKTFKTLPPKVLMVSAGEPMWRGALSASNSFFMHADRPLISENGTSTFIHELIHTISGISSVAKDDWITEGLAEYYSFEILFRAGGITEHRRNIIRTKLKQWSQNITNIRTTHSSGAVTAKAALLFDALDQEIKRKTQNAHSLDTIVQQLMGPKKASLARLQHLVETLLKEPSETLMSPLLALPSSE